MRRAGAILAVFLLGHPAAAGELCDRLGALSDPRSVFLVTLPDPEGLLLKGDLVSYPYSIDFSGTLLGLAAGFLVSSQISEVDLAAQPIRFLGFLDQQTNSLKLAYCLTALDPEAYVAGLGTPDGSAGSARRYQTAAGNLYATVLGQEVLVSPDAGLAGEPKAATRAFEPLPQLRSDVRIDVPVARVLELHGSWLAQVRSRLLEASDGLRFPAASVEISRQTRAELLDLALEAAPQLESVQVGLRLRGRELLVHVSLRAVPGSALSHFLAAQPSGSEALLSGLPDQALSAVGLRFRPTPHLIELLAATTSAAEKLRWSRWAGFVPVARGRSELRAELTRRLAGREPGLAAAQVQSAIGGVTAVRSAWLWDCQAPGCLPAALESPTGADWTDSLLGKLGVGLEVRRRPVEDPRLPGDASSTELRVGWHLPGTPGLASRGWAFPGLHTFVPLGSRLLETRGPDSVSFAAEALGWRQRPDWQRTDVERFPGLALLPGPRQLAGYVHMAVLLERQMQYWGVPAIGAAAAVVKSLGEKPDVLLFEAVLTGVEAQLAVRLPLEGALRAYRAQRQ